MSKRRKCVCGKESPLSEQRCPYCKRPLSMYGKYVTDEYEPDIPYKPYDDEDSKKPPVDAKESSVKQKKTKEKAPKRREGKEKKQGGAGKTVLVIFLLLIILLLGANVVLLLLDKEPESGSVTIQPPVVQTTPVDTAPDTTAPADTQPVQTDPPATNPPATQPPATEPPATQPPATEPPATEPPATEPPATQPQFEPNTLTATIFGREEIFYLKSTYVGELELSALYYAYNPRGEKMYCIKLAFDKNLLEGTYTTDKNVLHADVKITFNKVGSREYYVTYPGSDAKKYNAGTFIIEQISEDWMTYDGSFDVELYLGNKDSFVIHDAVFNFTIN